MSVTNNLFGREKIFSAIEEITSANVISVVNQVLNTHYKNQTEEEYLYWYRRGKQPILNREKKIRPEINNKVVVNNANQVCVFKNGYFLTKPAFYKQREGTEEIAEKVKTLNKYLYLSGKTQADNKVVNWFHTVGLGVIYVEQNNDIDTPAKVYALDPRNAFVVYSYKPGNKPIMGINVVESEKNIIIDVFTENTYFKLLGSSNTEDNTNNTAAGEAIEILSQTPNYLGLIPIIEYQYNDNRMGAFEVAIPIMDEINNIESNRADGVEQQVQQLIVAYNCNFAEDTTANTIMQAGMIRLESNGENKADIKVIESTLNQKETQTTLDDLYSQMMEKCGVPSSNRNAGSTSDNVGAVYLRSGWAEADTDCRNTEDLFKEANRLFDEVFLKILKLKVGFEIGINDFELCFPRTDMNNILVKTQSALNMKELGFAPELAFERSGLSNDALSDVEISRKYIDMKWSNEIQEETQNNDINANKQAEEDTNGTNK